MIADIDKKLKELDEEEENARKESEKPIVMTPELSEPVSEPVVVEAETLQDKIPEKEEPIIHVDADSIMSDSGISDDEFFDDFFNE